ncbi:hypothetical protein BT049_RS03370 [Vibrio parahaemolyticus]|nr:hypothetical protein [Vibrio parahaemolyticus]ELA7161072.1 hypothetical protein [Vibrio parahaemolyticus]MDG2998407.1 hypothetical protein [Vibrio parahaemolyticus]MDG3036296.1 hypothetical protein [Vibrio parahaemolyticus]
MTFYDWALLVSQSDGFEIFLRYMITLLGSFSMYLFSSAKGFEGSIPMLKRLFPRRKKVFYDRVDFLLVVFIGSAVGTIFFHPQDSLQALAAGFGWVGAMNIMLKPIEQNQEQVAEDE